MVGRDFQRQQLVNVQRKVAEALGLQTRAQKPHRIGSEWSVPGQTKCEGAGKTLYLLVWTGEGRTEGSHLYR